MNVRTLVVDDETLARNRICKLLAHESGLEIVGECSNGPDAISFIQEQRPDLAFLDVQMPEVTGFDVLRAVAPEIWPAIIFVTAFDQHALHAFEVHALDYLLKPFTQARLLTAVQHAKDHLQSREISSLNQQLSALLKSAVPERCYLNRLAVKTGDQTIFVRVEDIDYIESASNYAVFHACGQNHVLRETLSNLETELPPRLFARISRSIIVNLDKIRAIQSGPRGEDLALLQSGRQLLMTRNMREIQQKLQYTIGEHKARVSFRAG